MPHSVTTRPPEFDARVMAYRPGLLKLAARFVPREYREDLVTDTIMHALDKWQNFRADGGLWNWLAWTMRGINKEKARKAVCRQRRATFVPIDDHAYHLSTPATQHSAAEASELLGRLSDIRHGDILLRRAMGEGLREIGADYGLTRQRIQQREIIARKEFKKVAS